MQKFFFGEIVIPFICFCKLVFPDSVSPTKLYVSFFQHSNTILLFDRANYNKALNNLESALFDLNECVQLDSLNSDFHYSVAEIYFELSVDFLKIQDSLNA